MCVPCPPVRWFVLKLQAFDSVGEIMLRIDRISNCSHAISPVGTALSPNIYMTKASNVASSAQETSSHFDTRRCEVLYHWIYINTFTKFAFIPPWPCHSASLGRFHLTILSIRFVHRTTLPIPGNSQSSYLVLREQHLRWAKVRLL